MNTFLKIFVISGLVLCSAILFSAIIAPAPAFALVNTNCTDGSHNTISNPSTASIVLAQDSTVTVTLNAACSGASDPFGLSSPKNIYLGTGRVTRNGTVINVGQFSSGTGLIFYDTLGGTSATWYSGSASSNSDGHIHADVTQINTNQWQVGFEDMGYPYADFDYNDVVFTVTATPSTICTTHASQKCVGNAVYWFNSCNVQEGLVQQCTSSQTCQNAQCVNNCTPNATKACVGNAVYNFDSCGVQGTLYQQCTSNQICQNAQCINQTITCSSNTQCGTNTYTGSPYCTGNNVYQNYITYTCNNAGTPSSYCSNNTASQLKTTCTGNQICSGGSCTNQTITCSTNSQCGTNTYTGSPYCSSGNVYQNYITYTCNNPGTGTSYCSDNTAPQLKTTCAGNQVCTNGSCTNQTITCTTNSQCGTNAYTGSPYCSGGNVYQNYITYTCNNAGTGTSYCSDNTAPQLKTTCTGNQTCTNGSCTNQTITCTANTDCGTNAYTGSPFCQSGNVYQNYITYTCNNAGTASSYCSNNTAAQLKTTCTSSQTCSNGSCSNQNITCSANTDCGTNSYTGSPYCQGNNVYQNYLAWTCTNPGIATSYCSSSSAPQLKTTCSGNQTCNGGSCSGNNCTQNSYQQCVGSYLYWYDSCGNQGSQSQYCPNGCSGNSCQNNNNNVSVQTNAATNIYNNQVTLNGYLYNSNNNNNYCNSYVWFQYGPTTSYGSETTHVSQNYSGAFSQNITVYNSNYSGYHFRAVAQTCNAGTIYGQDTTFNGTSTTGNLTANKTVRNLSNGSGFASSTSAVPGDTLMFMITLQATGGQDVQNVVVRDYLPANLTYNNQLVVACTTNNSNYNNCNGNNYNYTGNISSGVYLNTIYSGQTVTLTYQVQVAGASNFAYGSTTLNNNVSVTSSNASNPTSNASVVVTRTAVYGASTVSTGLTNNFWVDSFFLPLLLTLIGLWMWKSGIFFGIEKWLDNKKKIRRGYKTEKELANRIATIQKTEKA